MELPIYDIFNKISQVADLKRGGGKERGQENGRNDLHDVWVLKSLNGLNVNKVCLISYPHQYGCD